LEWSINQRLLF